MSKFDIDTDEIRKSIALLSHVLDKMQSTSDRINKAYANLNKQEGTIGIRVAKREIIEFGKEFDRQWDNIGELKVFLNKMIELTQNGVGLAESALNEVDFVNRALSEPVITSNMAIKNSLGGNSLDIGTGALYYYGWKSEDGIWDGCSVYSVAMILANSGYKIDNHPVTPQDVYKENGNSNYMSWNLYNTTWIKNDISSQNNDQKVETIRGLLQNHPEGVIIYSGSYKFVNGESGAHFVVCTGVDNNGNLIVNDPYKDGLKGVTLSTSNLSAIESVRTLNS